MKNNYAVIGLGLFGRSVVNTLIAHHQEVLVIDENPELVNEFRDIATEAIIADSQNESALKQLGIANFDNVFITIGTDLEASIMTTMLCKEMGVKHIICKAENERHARVLEKLGADEVIQPERDMGKRIALRTMEPRVINDLDLSGKLSVAEFELSNNKLTHKSLQELDITNQYHVTVVAVSHPHEQGEVSPNHNTILRNGDVITIIGKHDDVERFEDLATK